MTNHSGPLRRDLPPAETIRKLPFAHSLSFHKCIDPKCAAVHCLGRDENDQPIFTFNMSEGLILSLYGAYEKLKEEKGLD